MITFFSILVLWLVSLCLHEYAHARVAFEGGDISVAAKGYLSMNPLRYMHPFMSVILPLIILAIGGIPLPGGAVYIEHWRLRSRNWEAAVAAAGPASNLALFVLSALPFTFGIAEVGPLGAQGTVWPLLAVFCYLQILATIINLVPIPGLDGFGILSPYLSYEVRERARQLGNAGILVLLLLIWFDTPVRDALFGAARALPELLGVPPRVIHQGWQNFRIGLENF